MLSPEYIAGFLDADGHIGIVRQKSTESVHGYQHKVDVTFVNRCKEVLQMIQSIYGGSMQCDLALMMDVEIKHKTREKGDGEYHPLPSLEFARRERLKSAMTGLNKRGVN